MNNYMALGYVRVSTENQLENYSIEEQQVRIESYCKAKGWTLLHTYVDGGFSGGNIDRPSLQAMLEAIRRGEADAVVVYKLDRLSRSQKDTLTLIEDEFLAHKTDFVSINENFDTSSPFGRAMIGILSVFAQLEKDQITERFTMGRIGRSKAGYYHGGPTPPTGYDYIDGKLVIEPTGAVQVQKMFDAFTSGASINAIYLRMQTEYGGTWSAAKIANILRNSVYISKVKFGGKEYAGQHEPLVSLEQFHSVRQLLSKRESPIKQPFRAEYLLSGLVSCVHCGARYSANHGHYKCYSRAKSCKRFIIDPDCKNDNWRIENLDAYVLNFIHSLCNEKSALHKIVATQKKRVRFSDAAAIQAKITSLDKQLEKLIALYQFSDIPVETVAEKIHALRAEKTALQKHCEAEQETLLPFPQRVSVFQQDFESSDGDARRMLVASLVERIEIDGTHAEVFWRT